MKAEAPAFLKSVHAANNQMNYGIIGTGGRGQYLLGLLKSVDNGNCVAICDIDDEASEKGTCLPSGNPENVQGLSAASCRQLSGIRDYCDAGLPALPDAGGRA